MSEEETSKIEQIAAAVARIELIASGVPDRDAKIRALQDKGTTIIETLSHIVRMIESMQTKVGDTLKNGVQSTSQKQADA